MLFQAGQGPGAGGGAMSSPAFPCSPAAPPTLNSFGPLVPLGSEYPPWVLQDVLGFEPLGRGGGGEAGSPRPVPLTATGVVGDWPAGVQGLPELPQPLGYEAGPWLVLGSSRS